ncbi:hypothetical protein [Pantoea sp. SM3]|uniref:hypothetical protein n=1 Tax=Pantoea sp. SM3 TaxID=1628192 RepID=UPI0005F7F63E|nr:hypothetical protein [Pantoea sp. SM3]KJV25422.1 hypothetical protein VI01_23710 [Pantoea sp. SM3]
MPVELDKIPPKRQLPEAPSLLRWIPVIALITLSGVMLSLWLWPRDMPTTSVWFWFCTLAIPLSAGFACFGFRLKAYENERDRACYWNQLHQQQHDRYVEQGQRAMGVLGHSFITSYGCNKLSSVLLTHGSMLQSQYSPTLQRAVTTARLSDWMPDVPIQTLEKRLAGYLNDVLLMLKEELSAVSDDKISVRIQHDGVLNDSHVGRIWQSIISSTHIFDLPEISTGDAGFMWVDPWLDRRESAVMLSVEINLFQTLRDRQSESVSALLLATPEWLSRYNAKSGVLIHRPVIATDQVSSLEDVLRWGKLSHNEPHTLWRSGVSQTSLQRVIQQATGLGYVPGNKASYDIDDLFGRPGAATGNISLICACEQAALSGNPQWVMVEGNNAHQLIVRKSES